MYSFLVGKSFVKLRHHLECSAVTSDTCDRDPVTLDREVRHKKHINNTSPADLATPGRRL